MDFIQELDNLSEYVAGLACTDMEYTCYPSKHSFAAGVAVEDILDKINLIKAELVNIKEGEGSSAAAKTLKSIVYHGNFSSDESIRLLEVANLIDNEIKQLRQSNHLDSFSSDASVNCKAMAKYIEYYVKNGGPHTQLFIDGLYRYLYKIEKEIKNLKDDLLINRIKNIIDHIK